MSVGAILGRTTYYLFRKLNFDFLAWHTYEHQNWDELDAALHAVAAAKGIKGPWANGIAVAVGDRYIDVSNGTTYVALVAHTTPSSGSFASDRSANPSRWAADTVPDGSITLAKLASIATDSFIGRDTSGTGVPEVLSAQQVRDITGLTANGQCRLNYIDSATIRLVPYKGNKILINTRPCSIPNAGVSLAATGLTANTNYYIYAVDANNDGVIDAIEADLVSNGAITHPTTGVAVKASDNTRTLVGMARPGAGPIWVDTAAQRFVRSYYNPLKVELSKSFSAPRTTTSTTLVEINTEIRIEFLVFDSELVSIQAGGFVTHSASANSGLGASFDGEVPTVFAAHTTNTGVLSNLVRDRNKALTAGYHYVTLFGYTESGTVTFSGATLNGHIT